MDSSDGRIYSFRVLKAADFSEVLKIVKEDFNTREPSSSVLKLSNEECEIAWGTIIQISLKEQSSVGAFCRDTGALAGCIISRLGKNISVEDGNVNLENAPLKSKQILEIESPLLVPGITAVLGTDNYIYTSILVCRLQDSCNGLGTELLRRSVEIARNAECEKYLILAFNYYVQRMTQKLGFETEKEVYYKDYVDPYTEEKIFFDVPEPHVKFTRVVKTL